MDFSTPDVPFYKSHISEIIAVIVIIIGALTLMALLNINLNEETNKTIQKVVTIESFDNELTGESFGINTHTVEQMEEGIKKYLTQLIRITDRPMPTITVDNLEKEIANALNSKLFFIILCFFL